MESFIVKGARTKRSYHITVPPHDVDRDISFNLVRCIMSTIGFLLLVSDIPRTGLGIAQLTEFGYKPIMPSVLSFFGPWAYSTNHVYRVNKTTVHSANNKTRLAAWAYKYDSVSIPHRGLAMHLNVTEYPACILYQEECDPLGLEPTTVFFMLDGLMTRFQARYFDANATSPLDLMLPFAYTTRSYWLDRFHHVALEKLWKRQEYRQHAAHYYASWDTRKYALCRGHANAVPLFCTHYVGWRVNPDKVYSPNATQPLWKHIALRLQYWQSKYPTTELDLMVFTTFSKRENRHRTLLPAVHFMTDVFEITTLIRGRDCAAGPSDCRTVFIDDYRYERGVVLQNAQEWYRLIAVLRGFAQGYVWIRLVCLWVGCYRARLVESKNRRVSIWRRLYRTWATFFKIPSHIVIYGSWPPIVCYALAHFMDCTLIHWIGDIKWASIDGNFNFDLLEYIRLASIQMRNVWLVSLCVKSLVGFQLTALFPRTAPWLVRDGIVGIRGFLISTTAWLTIFCNMRALQFRNSHVLEIWELPRRLPIPVQANMNLGNYAEYGFRFDLKAICVTSILAWLACMVVKAVVMVYTRWSGDSPTSTTSCRSFYVPYSAGTLWSRTTLCIYWRLFMNLTRKQIHFDPKHRYTVSLGTQVLTATGPRLSVVPAQPPPPTLATCKLCRHWTEATFQETQGCPDHEHIYDLERRDQPIWSAIRLINVAMMTDPLVLWQLCTVGIEMYIYNVKLHTGARQTYMVLPCPLDALLDATKTNDDTYTLVDTISSNQLPWTLLVQCG